MRCFVLVKRKLDQFTAAQFEPLLEPEAEHARQLHAEGVFRSIWSYLDDDGKPKGALIEMDVPDVNEVDRVLNTLPMAVSGMIEWQVLRVAPYRGFAPRSGK